MKRTLKTNLLMNTPLKIMSCILGYSLWTMLNSGHSSTLWVDVPVCFYPSIHRSCLNAATDPQDEQDKIIINAPEKIAVALTGKRIDLHAIDRSSLAIHIDTSSLHEGPNAIALDNKSLFLPDSIKLVHYRPANIVIDVKENKV